MTDADRADVIAKAVTSCRGVVGLHAGRWGEVATLGVHRRVVGVRVAGDDVEVHVVAAYGEPLDALAARVRGAVRSTFDAGRVDVVVGDVEIAETE